MTKFVQRGGMWVIVQMLLMGGVGVCGPVFHSANRTTIALVSGGVLLGIGAALASASALVLGRGLTPCLSPSGEAKLVSSGAYSMVRHPIYTSLMTAAFGWALFWQSWVAFAVALVLVPFFNAKAVHEEKWLSMNLPAYAGYAKKVRRFVPWIY